MEIPDGERIDMIGVVTIVIVPLLIPTLFGKRGILTRSPLTVGLKPSHFFVIMFIYLKVVLGDTLCQ